MILYNNVFFLEEKYASTYPSWVKYENYEECGDFIADYSMVKSRSQSLLARKAASFAKALGRLRSVRKSGD